MRFVLNRIDILGIYCINVNKYPNQLPRISRKYLGCVAQSVTCLTADPGVVSLIQAQCYTFPEIDHEIISTAILLLTTDSRRVVFINKRKYDYFVLEVLANS